MVAGLGTGIVFGPALRAADFHTNAIFNVTFSLPAQVQSTFSIPNPPLFTLTTNWSIPASSDFGALITLEGANQRAIAYNVLSNHLYLISRNSPTGSNYTIYALNGTNGIALTQLNTSGIYNDGAVGEGGIGLASMAVADDGAIYACNMSVDACSCGPNNAGNTSDSLFRIYRWADGNSDTAPVQIFSGDPAGQAMALRWGDTLAVRGSGTNTQILLDSGDGKYVALLAPTDSSLNTFTNIGFFNSKAPLAALGRSLQFASSNTFLRKGKGTDLQAGKWDGTNSFTITASSHLPTTLGPLIAGAFELGAALDFDGGASSGDSLKIYNLANFSAPSLLAKGGFPTNQQSNPEFAGTVIFAGANIWALDANNGLVNYQVSGPHTLTFLTASPGKIGNSQILQALANSLHSNNLSGGKLIIKTDQLGTDHFQSKFRIRKGNNDIDVSTFMPFNGPVQASVSAETVNSAGTNAIDYTVTEFSLTASGLSFDVLGFGIWKSGPVVYRGQTVMAEPFPNSCTVSAADGIGFSEGQNLTFHGSVTLSGRKIEVVSNQPPTVTLTQPSAGTFTAGTISLSANASDNDGRPTLVEFYQDGNKLGDSTGIGTGTTVFFGSSWTNATPGTYHIYAKATDDDGAVGFSQTNTITVNPAAP
jgi:hypothetical protein